MLDQGMDHWSSYYTPEKIQNKFLFSDVFLLYVNEIPVGTGSISHNPPTYYSLDDISCFTKSEKVGYLTMLAVKPDFQGKGYGKKLVKEREKFAKESDEIEYLRFDAKASYTELIKFHLNNKFKIVGVMDDEGEDYYLFEKKL